MFKDYKIPIAFLILVLIIILGVKAQAQNIILFDDDDYTGFWTPANLPIDTTTTSVFFYGEAPRTKVAKDSGGVSVRPYMRVWVDSTEILNDGEVFSLHAAWTASSGNDTLYCTPQGGGLSYTAIKLGTYNGISKFYYSFKVINRTAGEVKLIVYQNSGVPLLYSSVTGITGNSNNTFTGVTTAISGDNLNTAVGFVANGTFDGDVTNFSIYPVIDSTYGYTHNLPRPSDTTTFYYSQSVSWVQKDKDTIWIAAETDTVTVYPYVAPEFEEGAYTSDGNELYTIDGNRIYAKQEGE